MSCPLLFAVDKTIGHMASSFFFYLETPHFLVAVYNLLDFYIFFVVSCKAIVENKAVIADAPFNVDAPRPGFIVLYYGTCYIILSYIRFDLWIIILNVSRKISQHTVIFSRWPKGLFIG